MLPFSAALSGMPVTRCLLFVASALSAAVATAAVFWLTIVGEPGYSGRHYIQVNPARISIKGDIRIIPVRISRATAWTTDDGIQFRSAEAEVLVDCERQTACYLNAVFLYRARLSGAGFQSFELR